MSGLVYDIAWDRPTPAELRDAGVIAVCRYLSYDVTGKNLTPTEARSYADVGIRVVSNWEFAPRAASMGHDQGVKDALTAYTMHRTCGGPLDVPIYYSVDFNIPDYAPWLPNDNDRDHNRLKLGPVAGYFQAARDNTPFSMPLGAYGGYWAIKRLFDAGFIDYGWQTYAWSGDLWEPRVQLRQVHNSINFDGHNVDEDQTNADDFGAWFPGGYTPPPVDTPAPPVSGTHRPGTRECMLKTPYMDGIDVAFIQRFIGPGQCGTADGEFGPHTQRGVRWYQHMRGITADGIVGLVTWRNMGVTWTG